MSKKEFNIQKCVKSYVTGGCLSGVYHKDGYKIASDGRLMAVIKADYPVEFEGKVIATHKNSTTTYDSYVKYESVIPVDDELEPGDMPDMLMLNSVKGMNGGKDVVVNVNGFNIPVYMFGIIHNFAEAFGNVEMFVPKETSKKRQIVFRSNDNLLVLMPVESCTFSVVKGFVQKEPEKEPKTYNCDGMGRHRELKVTYKQLKEVCPNVLTIGKSNMLDLLNPMCTTWGQNGWNVKAYDFPGVIITSGEGANGVHIPVEIIKRYEAEVNKLKDENGAIAVDDYKELMDKFIVEAETWYVDKIKKSA